MPFCEFSGFDGAGEHEERPEPLTFAAMLFEVCQSLTDEGRACWPVFLPASFDDLACRAHLIIVTGLATVRCEDRGTPWPGRKPTPWTVLQQLEAYFNHLMIVVR